jgi:hypothetical protein
MRTKKSKTRKSFHPSNQSNPSNPSFQNFENEVTVYFFEMLLMIKLFHWKTFCYATHKATDKMYDKLNGHMDRFMEVLLGKSNVRMNLVHKKSISLLDLSREAFMTRIMSFKSYLVNISDHPAMKSMSNVDLLTIRDELLADLNQFLYLMSLK